MARTVTQQLEQLRDACSAVLDHPGLITPKAWLLRALREVAESGGYRLVPTMADKVADNKPVETGGEGDNDSEEDKE